MGRLLSLGFEFMGAQYQTLIRVKEKDTKIEYLVTVMNAELEQLLMGNNIITEENDCLSIEVPAQQEKQLILKSHIAQALGKYLKKATRIQAS